jgi:large subunit ribosomal protein L4
MPEAKLFTGTGEAGPPQALSDTVFGIEVNTALLHQAVVRQQANARQGTHDTRTRGEVAGSTKKMWRQKGTGRARQGAKRAPHWRHGGVVFGPHPRSHRQDMPRKMRVGALRSALAAKAAAGEVVVVQDLTFDSPSTKQMAKLIAAIAPGRSALLVLDAPQPAVQLSARNLPNVTAATTDNLNVVDILRHEHLVLSAAALRVIEGRYGTPATPTTPATEEAGTQEQANA